MLKVFLGFLVSVVVLLSSAYGVNTPTYATSAAIIITNIQAGGIGAATQEFIILYNNSPDEIDITGWCLTNKTNVAFACFGGEINQTIYLPPYKHAVVTSNALSTLLPAGTSTMSYIPASQSSGSITGSVDTISLIDHTGMLVDRHAWTTALAAGAQLERRGAGAPMIYQDTDSPADWQLSTAGLSAADETYIDTTIVDVCLNIEGIQPKLPAHKELNETGECVDIIVPQIAITEILPNAIGSDEGQEFIELYNPGTQPVSLAKFKMFVGQNYESSYIFPVGSVIQPNSYVSFSNSSIPFTLLNSSSRVMLVYYDGSIVSESPAYTDPKDGSSWGIYENVWQYSNYPTPGLANIRIGGDPDDTGESNGATPQPCAANQYRNPETNRCRLVSLGVSIVTPCKDNQYRSEETNRCRNIVSDDKTVTPCDVGQERSLETNRCRKIAIEATPAACKDGQERNPDTNRCRTVTKMPSVGYAVTGDDADNGANLYAFAAVGGVLLLAIGYAVWEWHAELATFFKKAYRHVRQFVRMRK